MEEDSSETEKLKTSLHYSVGKICTEISEQYNVKFSKEFIATLAELAFHQAGAFARDVELFAKHAKRTTINVDDVKLLARKSKTLYEHLCKMDADEISNAIKDKSKRKKTVSGTETSPDDVKKDSSTSSKTTKGRAKKMKTANDEEPVIVFQS